MGRQANYEVLQCTWERIVLKDIGPWDHYMTITNAAESVVAEVDRDYGIADRKVLYYDSDGELTEFARQGWPVRRVCPCGIIVCIEAVRSGLRSSGA
jgi:hypothetical protein